MPLVKPITKHGNSAGIILDQTILKMVGWEVGTEVEVRRIRRLSCAGAARQRTPQPALDRQSPRER